jgi:hypothetical protein
MSGTAELKRKFFTEIRQYMIQCFDDLITQFPQEQDLIILKVFVENDIPAEQLTKMLHESIYPVRQMIYKKDAEFFLSKFKLFDTLDTSKVNHFKKMWLDPSLTSEGRDILWNWFILFAKFTEQYETRFKNMK